VKDIKGDFLTNLWTTTDNDESTRTEACPNGKIGVVMTWKGSAENKKTLPCEINMIPILGTPIYLADEEQKWEFKIRYKTCCECQECAAGAVRIWYPVTSFVDGEETRTWWWTSRGFNGMWTLFPPGKIESKVGL
jgi:hypothetical protein